MPTMLSLNLQIAVPVQISDIKNIKIELDTKICPGDNVLGEITPLQKELFTLAVRLEMLADKFLDAAKLAHTEDYDKVLKAKAHELSMKAMDIMSMFESNVMDTHNLWNNPGIDIEVRKGWQVVWTERVEEVASYIINATNN